MSADELERRYRRLLAIYPWEHRRAYEEEMLAVLLADARPGQTRPSVGDAVNLLGAGLRARLRVGARGFTEPAWADAAAVTGVLVALVLVAAAGWSLVDQAVPGPLLPPPVRPGGPDQVDWLRVGGWAAVLVAALVGLRRVAAGLAWAGVAAWVVLVGSSVTGQSAYVIDTLPQFALALLAAGALTLPAPSRRALRLLGRRGLAAFTLAAVLPVGVLAASRLGHPTADPADVNPWYSFHGLYARSPVMIVLFLAVLGLAAVAVLFGLAALAPRVRWRLVVLLSPVAALTLLIDTPLAGEVVDALGLYTIPLVVTRWAALLLVPAMTFLAGVVLLRHREATRRVVLGRTADRKDSTT
ncbi:hypothetical protein GA0074695_3759 [Micromonospora viridifaciens]|uniref:Uncharacterized protein n=1 Tax=Micromonospora viridifaciens TaxID=1881 RepID=A0A1C4Y0A3_MICVI|nr:hypothetical protein [Micromonospora viridifaciens]SCF14130.1 hypothetical protein GA0074695_3759 [Micromonospora viridifaciens]